nr:retrovirus-related Pol polyprotein from transposon TNT 1-94 [Tanacetum cinerariifolium]
MSLSLSKNAIVVGADNRPPMLDKTNYSSWASRMMLYIESKEHGKLLIDSVLNGPFQYRTMYYPQLSSASQQYYPSPAPQRSYDAPMIQSSQYQPHVVNYSLVVHQQSYQASTLQQSHQAPTIQQSSATENQAIIQDGRVTIQTVQGRQTQGYANNKERNTATNPGVNRQGDLVQAKVVKCYNCQEEGHFARQFTKPKRPKNFAWFKEKMLLTESLES